MKEKSQPTADLTKANERLEHLNRVLKAIRNVNQLIIKADDPRYLIERGCQNLTETMGYFNAWIALLGGDSARALGLPDAGPVAAAAAAGLLAQPSSREAGFDAEFEALRGLLERGEFPCCMKDAMASEGVLVVGNPAVDCPDCPLHDKYGGRAGLVRRLDFNGVTYGTLTASVPAAYARDAEEQDLFNEVAGDLAFALHKIAAARKLEESRRYLGLVIEGSGVGTWEWNVQTNETLFNEQWAAMVGYTIEELTPYDYATWEDLVHPEDLEQVRQALADCVAGKTEEFNCEFRMQHKDGSWVWILDRGRVMTRNEAGKALSMFGTHTDITGIKQGEEALRKEREFSERVIEDGPVGIIKVNLDGEIVFANRHAEGLFGLKQSAIQGRAYNAPDWHITGVDGSPFPDEDLPYRRVMATGQAVYDVQHAITTEDGAWLVLSINGAPLHDAQGQIDGVVFAIQDITKKRADEEALRISEDRLSKVLRAANDGMWDWDLKTDIVFFDPRYYEMAGYAVDEFPHRLEEFQGRVHPEDVDDVMAHAESHLKGEADRFEVEFRFRRKSGDWMWIAGRGIIVERDEEGMPLRFVGTHQDITERKRAEEALQVSEDRLSKIMRAANDGMWDWDLKTNVVYFDPRYYEMAGYEVDEFPHRLEEFQARVHPQDIDDVMAHAENHLKGEADRFEEEFRFRRKRGDWMWIAGRGIIVERDEEGMPLRFVGTHQDITKRKLAEAERERLNKAIEQSGEIIVITDAEGSIQYVNPAFSDITGYDLEDVLGQNPRLLKSGEHGEEYYQDLWDTISSGKTWKGQFVNKRKDGSLYTEDATISPVFNPDGDIVNYVAAKRDVSDELKLEAQLQQAQKMEAVGRLAGGVAHDFNNMLGVILGRADIVLEKMTADQRYYADLMEIKKAGERSADLTRQLLAFARKQTIAPKVIDLNETVDGMLKMLQRLIGEDIEIAWIPGSDVWPVKIDPAQVDQILANLCVNARDAITGFGKVTIETGNSIFDEAYCRDHAGCPPGEYALLAVSDDGCGMDSETMSHLFEPFFTTRELGKGTGLGLSTVYGAVTQNNGFIHVYSEPGQGTTFKIYLPRHKTRTTPQPQTEPETTREHGHETILLVEDEPAILEVASMMLARQGYTVVEASTPGEAIRLATEHPGEIHLLMTDVVMPEMNGRDLARNILSLHPGVKCLFMSGYTANVIAHHSVLDEGVNFIQKPFSIKDLTDKVREALDPS